LYRSTFLNTERKTEETALDHSVTFPGGADLPVHTRITQADGNQASRKAHSRLDGWRSTWHRASLTAAC
jgi:hypothetical protein